MERAGRSLLPSIFVFAFDKSYHDWMTAKRYIIFSNYGFKQGRLSFGNIFGLKVELQSTSFLVFEFSLQRLNFWINISIKNDRQD